MVSYSVCAGLFGTFLGAKPEAKVLADVPNDDSSELNCLDQLNFFDDVGSGTSSRTQSVRAL